MFITAIDDVARLVRMQAALPLADTGPDGIASSEETRRYATREAVCRLHHLAYDRNLMGIDPDGVVHIAHKLLEEVDGPMLKSGLQAFHGEPILIPKRMDERRDPSRLEERFSRFEQAA